MSKPAKRRGGDPRRTRRGQPATRRNKSIPSSTVPRAKRPARAEPRFAGVAARGRGALAAPWVGLAALYVACLVVYGLLSREQSVPWLFPDEFIYGNVAQNIAYDGSATWRGEGQGIPLLYPIAISFPFRIGSPVDGYALAKLLGVALCSLVVVPVWLLARELVGHRLALAAAGLSAAGAWMSYSALLISENLAYPLATASLCATVIALRRPGSRWIWVALAFSAAAVYTRVILVALPIAIFGALLLDVARQPAPQRRERAQLHRAPLVLLGAVFGVGLVVFFAASTVGRYALPEIGQLSVGGIADSLGEHALSLAVMTGGLPLVATVGLALRAENWRDPDSGPLLALLLPALVVVLLVAATFGDAFSVPWPIERYIIYVVPLTFVALLLAPGRVSWPLGLALSTALALALLGVPTLQQAVEQAAVLGATKRLDPLGDPAIWIAIVWLAVGVAGMWLLTRRPGAAWTGALGAAGLVGILVAVVSQSAWHDQIRRVDQERAAMPSHLDWVERATTKRVGLVNEGQTVTFDVLARSHLLRPEFEIELFNRNVVDDVYYSRYATLGREPLRVCPWRIRSDGAGASGGPGCAAPPATLLFMGGTFVSTLRDERVLATPPPQNWRLVEAPSVPPRHLAVVRSPCNEATCTGDLRVNTWLERPGAVVVTFTGADAPAEIVTGNRLVTLSPGRKRTIRVPVPRGPGAAQMLISGSGNFPDVQVRVREGSKVTRVF